MKPDQAARAYLMVIARIPDAVSKALDAAACERVRREGRSFTEAETDEIRAYVKVERSF